MSTMNHQEEVRRFLESKGWPSGLITTLLAKQCTIPERRASRFFICDDSTSMQSEDGEVVIDQGGNKVVEECTRWDEMRQTIQFHQYLSSLGQFPTEYRLLNEGTPMVIGATREQDAISMSAFNSWLVGMPTGGTPLCYHIDEVVRQITAAAPELRRNGQKAAVVIMTDGEASDGNIEDHMKPLCNLPCMVVVRLCTGQEEIIQYWDALIDKLELYLDVIDDPMTEAVEVSQFNDWFVYGEPLHRLREFGVPIKEYFAMDYKKFNHEQMKALIALFFGLELSSLPNPKTQWSAFLAMVNSVNNTTGSVVWNPITKNIEKWINMDKLIAAYSPDPANDHLAPPPATSADLAKEVIVRRHRGGEPIALSALDEPQPSMSSDKAKDKESSPHPHLPSTPAPPFLPPTTPPPPPPYTTIPPPPAPQAAATTTSGTIIDAEFPAGGPLGLGLLVHRLTYTTSSGQERVIVCAIVDSSGSAILAGDYLLSVNNLSLIHDGLPSFITADDAILQPYFENIRTTLMSQANVTRTLRCARLLRSHVEGIPNTTAIDIIEANQILRMANVKTDGGGTYEIRS